jgi:hypothetical protein
VTRSCVLAGIGNWSEVLNQLKKEEVYNWVWTREMISWNLWRFSMIVARVWWKSWAARRSVGGAGWRRLSTKGRGWLMSSVG